MTRKVNFFKLEQTCGACPSQWEYFENGYGAYVRYRHNNLTVYVNQVSVNNIFDCIESQHLVLSIKGLSNDPKKFDCGVLTTEDLLNVLVKHNLIEGH